MARTEWWVLRGDTAQRHSSGFSWHALLVASVIYLWRGTSSADDRLSLLLKDDGDATELELRTRRDTSAPPEPPYLFPSFSLH